MIADMGGGYRDPAERQQLLAEIDELRKEVKRLTPTNVNTCMTCRHCASISKSNYSTCNGPPLDRAEPYHGSNAILYCVDIRKPNEACPDWKKRRWWQP